MRSGSDTARRFWIALRVYRDSCEAVDELLARDPGEWWGCYAGARRDDLQAALNERDDRLQDVMNWAVALRWRVDEHAESDN
jgi:hypothetical protein